MGSNRTQAITAHQNCLNRPSIFEKSIFQRTLRDSYMDMLRRKIKLFICYRRADTSTSSGRLYDYLSDYFGKRNVFKDIFSMEGGDKIREKIQYSIERSNVFLLVIGRQWMQIETNRRSVSQDKEDFVTYEILSALKKNMLIIPILVEGATMPEEHDLPEELKELANINACILSTSHYEYDIKRLIADVKDKAKKKGYSLFRTLLIAAAVLLLAYIVLSKHLDETNSITNELTDSSRASKDSSRDEEIKILKIGSRYVGGLVFYVDSTGRHGLVCSEQDLSTGSTWDDALSICKKYGGGGFEDWHLPTKDELTLLYLKKDSIKWLNVECSFANFGNCSYWSSTEMDNKNFAWNLYFVDGVFWKNFGKSGLSRVRAIRAF